MKNMRNLPLLQEEAGVAAGQNLVEMDTRIRIRDNIQVSTCTPGTWHLSTWHLPTWNLPTWNLPTWHLPTWHLAPGTCHLTLDT